MGDTRVDVAASTSKIIENAETDFVGQTIINSFFKERSFNSDLLRNLQGSMKYKFNRVYNYGRDTYTRGLPRTSNTRQSAINQPEVTTILEGIEGQAIEYKYYSIDQNPWERIALSELQKQGHTIKYDPSMPNPINITMDGDIWLIHSTALNTDNEIELVLYRSIDLYEYEYKDVVFSNLGLVEDNYYYVASYYTGVDTNFYTFWWYDPTTNIYPELDLTADTIDSGNPYFPVVPIRWDNQDLTAESERSTDDFITSETLLKKISLDYIDLGIAIHGDPDMPPAGNPIILQVDGLLYTADTEEPYDLNLIGSGSPDVILNTSDPDFNQQYSIWSNASQDRAKEIDEYNQNQGKLNDIDDIDYAYIIFGVQLGDDDKIVNKYLYEFFLNQYNNGGNTKEAYDAWLNQNSYFEPPRNRLTIGTAIGSSFGQRLEYHYIEKQILKGKLGKVGDVFKSFQDGESKIRTKYDIPYDTSLVILSKQITEDTYERLEIRGLIHEIPIYKATYYVQTTVRDLKDSDKEGNFVILLDRFIANDMNTFDEIDLYTRSILLSVTSLEITKLKWYESNFFLHAIKSLSIFITIVSFGTAAFAANSFYQFAVEAIKQSLYAIVIAETFQLVIKIIGIEAAIILAALLTIASLSTKFSDSFAKSVKDLPFAEDLLKLVPTFIESTKSYIDEELKNLMSAAEKQKEEYEEELDELEKLQKELDSAFNLNPYIVTDENLSLLPNESPDDFFTRTIHLGNIGVKSLDTIEYYVDSKLQLPDTRNLLL